MNLHFSEELWHSVDGLEWCPPALCRPHSVMTMMIHGLDNLHPSLDVYSCPFARVTACICGILLYCMQYNTLLITFAVFSIEVNPRKASFVITLLESQCCEVIPTMLFIER